MSVALAVLKHGEVGMSDGVFGEGQEIKQLLVVNLDVRHPDGSSGQPRCSSGFELREYIGNTARDEAPRAVPAGRWAGLPQGNKRGRGGPGRVATI